MFGAKLVRFRTGSPLTGTQRYGSLATVRQALQLVGTCTGTVRTGFVKKDPQKIRFSLILMRRLHQSDNGGHGDGGITTLRLKNI